MTCPSLGKKTVAASKQHHDESGTPPRAPERTGLPLVLLGRLVLAAHAMTSLSYPFYGWTLLGSFLSSHISKSQQQTPAPTATNASGFTEYGVRTTAYFLRGLVRGADMTTTSGRLHYSSRSKVSVVLSREDQGTPPILRTSSLSRFGCLCGHPPSGSLKGSALPFLQGK